MRVNYPSVWKDGEKLNGDELPAKGRGLYGQCASNV